MLPDYEARQAQIRALLDSIEEASASRPLEQIGSKEYQQGFPHAMPRVRAEAAIGAVLGVFECRAGSTASAYAYMDLYRALGIDFDASKIVWLKNE
jgi:hypothetical protein